MLLIVLSYQWYLFLKDDPQQYVFDPFLSTSRVDVIASAAMQTRSPTCSSGSPLANQISMIK